MQQLLSRDPIMGLARDSCVGTTNWTKLGSRRCWRQRRLIEPLLPAVVLAAAFAAAAASAATVSIDATTAAPI